MAIETVAEPTVESPVNRRLPRLSARPVARRAPAPRRTRASRPSGCDRRLHQAHVMSEEIFRSVLLRERRRANRFNQPFLLFLVGVDKQADAELPALPAAVVDALGAVTRDTDVLGWFKGQAVLGLIVPELGASGVESGARSGSSNSQRAGPPARRRCAPPISVGLHAHMPATDAAKAGLPSVEPIVSSLRPVEEQSWRELFKRVLDVCGSGALLLILSPLCFWSLRRSSGSSRPVRSSSGRCASDAGQAVHDAEVPHDAGQRRQRDASGVREAGSSSRAAGPRPRTAPSSSSPTIRGSRRSADSAQDQPRRVAAVLERVRGDMSLVGPRPPLPYEVEQYKPWHCRRVLEAKPGITGLWQVDRPQPDDVRRNGAPRPAIRQELLALDRRQDSARDARGR